MTSELFLFYVNMETTTISCLNNEQQGISGHIVYCDLVYKFIRIVGKPDFSDQFKKIIKLLKNAGYNLDIMRQSECLVLNPK